MEILEVQVDKSSNDYDVDRVMKEKKNVSIN